jgi:hypothetical protein
VLQMISTGAGEGPDLPARAAGSGAGGLTKRHAGRAGCCLRACTLFAAHMPGHERRAGRAERSHAQATFEPGSGLQPLNDLACLGIRSMIPSRLPPALSPPKCRSTPSLRGGPIGVLRFQDGAAFVDEVSFSASAMPLPEPGGQYEVWLLAESGEERRSVGYLALDAEGNGITSFVDAQGRNLLSSYNGVEITLEPSPDENPNPSGRPVFSPLQPEGCSTCWFSFGHRMLLVCCTGLWHTQQAVHQDDPVQSGMSRALSQSILNVLVGSQSPGTRPGRRWRDQRRMDNGDNSGRGSYAHAEFTFLMQRITCKATANTSISAQPRGVGTSLQSGNGSNGPLPWQTTCSVPTQWQ